MDDTSLSSERPLKATYSTRSARKKGGTISQRSKEDGDVSRVTENAARNRGTVNITPASEKLKEASPNVPSSTPPSKSLRRRFEPASDSGPAEMAAKDSDNVKDESQTTVSSPNHEVKEAETINPSKPSLDKSNDREGQDHDDMSDDTISVAESSKATRKRKNENDRKEWFLEDKDCETSEPHRVKCARCKNWIDLHPKRKYVMKFWLAHKKACVSPDVQVSEQTEPSSNEPVPSGPVETIPPQTELQPPVADHLEPDVPAASAQKRDEDQFLSPDGGLQDGREVSPLSVIERSSRSPTPQHEYLPSSSKKRERDDDEESPTRAVRPRTTSYVPAPGHSLWQTLTLPIRSFVAGFKEGLSRDSV